MGSVAGSLPSQMSFKGLILSLILSIYLTLPTITPTMECMKVFTIIVENVLPRLSEVVPHVDDMVEREHRAELLRLYDQFDKFKNQEDVESEENDVENELIKLIKGPKMLREGQKFTYLGSVSSRGERNEIQRMMLEEMSFTSSDNSQDLSGECWWSSSSSSDNSHDISGEGLWSESSSSSSNSDSSL
jgi:hypothetical protein